MIVPVHGAQLHYTTSGNGPVCLIPTAIGTKPYERMTSPHVTDRFRVAYVDLRGGGRSSGQPTDLTFDVLADDLEAIRNDLGVDRVGVLGHSVLGALAIEYARRRPSHVSHVILAGTPPKGDMAWLAQEASAFFERDATEDRKRALRERMAARPVGASPGQTFLAQSPARFFDAAFDAAPLFAEAETNPALLAHILGTLTRDWDISVDASSLQVPVLVAHGRYDYTVPHLLWEGVVGRIPRATLRIFEQSGHQPFFEEPERFVDHLTSWMREMAL